MYKAKWQSFSTRFSGFDSTLFFFTPLNPFHSLFSRTTWVSWHKKCKPFWILMKQEMMGWQWHQLDHMQIICTLLQTVYPPIVAAVTNGSSCCEKLQNTVLCTVFCAVMSTMQYTGLWCLQTQTKPSVFQSVDFWMRLRKRLVVTSLSKWRWALPQLMSLAQVHNNLVVSWTVCILIIAKSLYKAEFICFLPPKPATVFNRSGPNLASSVLTSQGWSWAWSFISN